MLQYPSDWTGIFLPSNILWVHVLLFLHLTIFTPSPFTLDDLKSEHRQRQSHNLEREGGILKRTNDAQILDSAVRYILQEHLKDLVRLLSLTICLRCLVHDRKSLCGFNEALIKQIYRNCMSEYLIAFSVLGGMDLHPGIIIQMKFTKK